MSAVKVQETREPLQFESTTNKIRRDQAHIIKNRDKIINKNS